MQKYVARSAQYHIFSDPDSALQTLDEDRIIFIGFELLDALRALVDCRIISESNLYGANHFLQSRPHQFGSFAEILRPIIVQT